MDVINFIFSIQPVPAFCFAIGLFLLIVEMFHPGFGVPGITGLILLVVGIFLSARNFTEAMVLIIIILALIGIMLSFVINSAKKGFLSRKLILKTTSNKEAGFIGSEDLSGFLNQEGVTLTILRPAGTADFNGAKIDVVSEGEFLDKGSPVKVIKVEGRRVIVRLKE